MVTLLALFLVASTYAKYTSTVTVTSTAVVAKWSFKVNEREITGQEVTEIPIDLFETIKNADMTETTEASNDSGVKQDGGTKKIAPGTGGEFALQIHNASDVVAEYKTEYTVSNTSNIPLQYSLDKKSWSQDIKSLNGDFSEIDAGEETTTQTIYWKWGFEDNDTAVDTALGMKAANAGQETPTITIKAKIIAQQKDNKD